MRISAIYTSSIRIWLACRLIKFVCVFTVCIRPFCFIRTCICTCFIRTASGLILSVLTFLLSDLLLSVFFIFKLIYPSNSIFKSFALTFVSYYDTKVFYLRLIVLYNYDQELHHSQISKFYLLFYFNRIRGNFRFFPMLVLSVQIVFTYLCN